MNEEDIKLIDREINIPAGKSVIVNIPELSILSNQIDTYPFKSKDNPPVELG